MAGIVASADLGSTLPALPDRVSIWPLDERRVGVDVTDEGASGYELASRHEQALDRLGAPYSFRQELGGAWTIRLTTRSGTSAAWWLSSSARRRSSVALGPV